VGEVLNNWDATYTYKKNGLLDVITQKNGNKNSYTYEGTNLTEVKQTKYDGTNLNVFGYGYDNNNNQTSKRENGALFSFTYDKLNRIETSSQFNEQYTYDTRGNRQTLQSNNLMNLNGISYTYDDRNRLTQVNTVDGKNISYRYNGDGLLYERMENGTTTRYYYDGPNMIAEGTVNSQIVDNTSASIQYTGTWFDTSMTGDYYGTSKASLTANDSAQFSFTGSSIAIALRKGPGGGMYDIVLDGVTVVSNGDTYSANRYFQSIVYSNSSLINGTHTIKVIVKGTKNPAASTYGVNIDYIAYGDGSASLKARYMRGQGLVARVDSYGNKLYYQHNGHGDVIGLTDGTGAMLDSYTYDMWGNPLTTQETVAQPFRYSGEYYDSTTGLQYLRARWYDPSVGRFISEDSYEGQIDNPLSLNLYTYVS
ncbi:RHS repeat-associated core domain-containing protein, partial [Paenibacillus sp. SI8]|uniref:RHS repeat-associated core domain-containing protein n=1 Tax=unclassified Paenibacillus TaxID=185978 RepID=UPI003467AAA4